MVGHIGQEPCMAVKVTCMAIKAGLLIKGQFPLNLLKTHLKFSFPPLLFQQVILMCQVLEH